MEGARVGMHLNTQCLVDGLAGDHKRELAGWINRKHNTEVKDSTRWTVGRKEDVRIRVTYGCRRACYA